MSVLTRSALEASPLADLHTIASEIGIDGFRRLRKADLIDKIIGQQGGEDALAEAEADVPIAEASDNGAGEADEAPKRRSRGGRGGRTRRKAEDDDGVEAPQAVAEVALEDVVPVDDVIATEDEVVEEELAADEADEKPRRRSRGGRGRDRDRDRDRDDESPRAERSDRDRGGRAAERDDRDAEREDRIVEGTVELLANGSGFVRVSPPEASDDDVYVSAAQVRRCELVSGDQVAGPVREPRRSERYPSLVRIDTINGRPADEVAEGTHFDDL
ncbi:MAG: transcription termination factor Rho, partial [Baekduia sp.]|nr:transcription termination factor Rho [Baekduia sp.]